MITAGSGCQKNDRGSCFVLGADPRPWRRSERRRDPGDLRSSCFVLGPDPRPWRRSERRRDPGDLRSSCFVLGPDPRSWRRSERRRDPGDLRAAASPWVQSRRPGGRPRPLQEIQRVRGHVRGSRPRPVRVARKH